MSPPLPPGRHLELDFAGGRDELAGHRPGWAAVRAALIRPDGHVAWATEDPAAPRPSPW
ncbi:hypothetical protein ACH347_31895 [Saccharopolyspora sp. 5N102]|uniref:aromatic-ring hydroxylase C-terminal domain-containing protein n=1 Tax=Saccharopolyspora sp. 5N102 TaxID=3375155 RepID=UPI0037ADD8BC